MEVTNEMVDAAAQAFTTKPTEATYVVARRMIEAALKVHEANKQHLVTKDAMTNCVHVLPMDFVKNLSNGTQNLKHLSEKERDAIVRCIANAVVELCNPTPNPVGYVKTVGGYPDESEHRAEWVVKYKELKDGQPLYTTTLTREPLSASKINSIIEDVLPHGTMLNLVREIEQAHGIGAIND